MKYSFQKNCKNKLCQFQHDVTDEINDISEDDQIDTDENLNANINAKYQSLEFPN